MECGDPSASRDVELLADTEAIYTVLSSSLLRELKVKRYILEL